ncbi:hypothetical protein DSO57_1035776 [Entomophthora muscae]|uniref:Uncharacterized protein n=1 Tax=Entomophthora muscae TaxID=34485 RepID=A0ACC2SNM2_9FUNG|nr:hypothetical protein DSO57_1035776 [Entomophthora muscae]
MEFIVYPGLVFAAATAYKGYKLLEVPKELHGVPGVSTYGMLKSLISGEPFDKQFDRLIRPALRKNRMARVWMRGQWDLIITDAKLGREILANSDIFSKAPVGGDQQLNQLLARKMFGTSNIVSSDDEDWRRHRKVANPAFKKQWQTSLFGDCMLDLFSNVDNNVTEPINIHDQFQRLTLDALGKGVFSYDFKALQRGEENHYLRLYNDLNKMIFSPIYFMFPMLEKWVPSRQKGHEMKDEFRAFLGQLISDRKKEIENGSQADDLLSLMIKETLSENSCLSDEEVINDVFVFFLAGHDTTANTLTTILYYLSKHQDIQERARQEVLSIVGNNQEVVCPTIENTKAMGYINCIIKESMRIVTTASQLRRYCRENYPLGDGTVAPKGCSVIIHSWAIHHDPEIYPEPEVYNPDRFIEPHGAQAQNWMAFGSGSRMCIGLNFSLVEQRVVLAMLLQKYTFTLGPNSASLPTPTISSSGLTRPVNVDVIFTSRV